MKEPMTAGPPLIEKLARMPRSERASALESLVTAEFRNALMMTGEETLIPEQNYFELGLSSLSLMEVKERLEAALGAGISADVLFSHPTVRQLLEYLSRDVLGDLLVAPGVPDAADRAERTETRPAGIERGDRATAQDILDDLFDRFYAGQEGDPAPLSGPGTSSEPERRA
jgi:aryl carrier-like protein